MIRVTTFFLLVFFALTAVAQSERKLAAEAQVMMLKNGTLVVRLKTNDKSIEGYQQAGKEKLAEKLELDNRLLNLYLMQSFLGNFNFCKLLFIKARDTKELFDNEPYIFLNETLNVDSSLSLTGPYLVAEYGEAVSNMNSSNYNYDAGTMQESQNPASTSALVILDTSGSQLTGPFPYFCVVNISLLNLSKKHQLNNPKKPDDKRTPFDVAVRTLNQRLINYYLQVYTEMAVEKNVVSATIRNNNNVGKDAPTKDPQWWEDHNPNKNADAMVLKLRIEQNKVIDEKKHLRGK